MKGPYFIQSKFEKAFDYACCDDCGRLLNEVSNASYYNPKKRARIKNICEECYHWRMQQKHERYLKRLGELEEAQDKNGTKAEPEIIENAALHTQDTE